MFKEALKLCAIPILIAMLVTPTRFALELAGIPDVYVFLIGLLWLTLASAAYWAIKVARHRSPI